MRAKARPAIRALRTRQRRAGDFRARAKSAMTVSFGRQGLIYSVKLTRPFQGVKGSGLTPERGHPWHHPVGYGQLEDISLISHNNHAQRPTLDDTNAPLISRYKLSLEPKETAMALLMTRSSRWRHYRRSAPSALMA